MCGNGGGDACGGGSDSQWGRTVLGNAADRGRADCARLLIDAGANIHARDNVRVGRCFAGVLFCYIFLFINPLFI